MTRQVDARTNEAAIAKELSNAGICLAAHVIAESVDENNAASRGWGGFVRPKEVVVNLVTGDDFKSVFVGSHQKPVSTNPCQSLRMNPCSSG